MAYRLPTSLVLLTALGSSACSMDLGGGDLGFTVGGSQDIELAREIIDGGGVPGAEQFTAEGLFSQHDIDTPNPEPCAALLCPRAAIASVEPVDGSGAQVLVQLALASNLDTLERKPLNLAVVVDISGSMNGERLDSTKAALHTMIDQLGPEDRVSLVSFSDDARVEAPSMIMDDGGRAELHSRVSALETEGATDIEAGLERGYATIDGFVDGFGGHEDRLMLFTDAQPNVGATDPGSFVGMAKAKADAGVGISVFGVGIDLGAELARSVSEVRGGNSFYLSDADAIATVFDTEFDAIVTPVAYALHFKVRPAAGFSFLAAYGTPDADASGEIDVSVATAFLSARGGAMAVILDGDLDEVTPGSEVVSFALDYESLDGELLGGSFDATWWGGDLPIGETGEADSGGVAKLAVLFDEFLALEAGASYCEGSLDRNVAVGRIEAASARLGAMASLLGDSALAEEAALMSKLASNVSNDGC